MNIFRSIFKFAGDAPKTQRRLSNDKIQVKKLAHVMEIAESQQKGVQPPLRKSRHAFGISVANTKPVTARLPLSYVKGNISNSSPWWDSAEIARHFPPENLTEEQRVNNSNVFLIKTETRTIELLNGEPIKTVRKIFYDIERKHRYKELYSQNSDGTLIDYNKIPKHLMQLDGINKISINSGKDVVVVEGYPAAESLRLRNIDAVGIISGTFDVPSERTLDTLLSARSIVLWPDSDSAGVMLMKNVANQLKKMGATDSQIKFIRWEGASRKSDAYDFKGSDEELDELVKSAEIWSAENQYAVNSILHIVPPKGLSRLMLGTELRSPTPELKREFQNHSSESLDKTTGES